MSEETRSNSLPQAERPIPQTLRRGFFSRNWGKIAVSALVAAGAGYGGVQYSLGPKVETVRVERRELVQKVVASGRVRSLARISLGSIRLGNVTKVLVEEGQYVHEGDLLVQLANGQELADVAQAKAAVAQADARLGQLRSVSAKTANEALKQAEIQLARSELGYTRAEQLAKAQAIAQSELDDAEKARDLARSQRDNALMQLQSLSRGGSDERLLFAGAAHARALLQSAQVKLDQTEIRAPANGTVLTRHAEPGSVVQPGTTLLVMAKEGPIQLSVEPDEKSLLYLQPNQTAIASADAFPSQLFSAKILSISPAVDPDRGTIEVKLSVPEPPAFLRPDMTVSVEIEVQRKDAALCLRSDVIRDSASKAPWVMAVAFGRTHRNPVKLGIHGEGLTEITEGLGEGDWVIPPSAGPLDEGRKVRPVPAPARR